MRDRLVFPPLESTHTGTLISSAETREGIATAVDSLYRRLEREEIARFRAMYFRSLRGLLEKFDWRLSVFKQRRRLNAGVLSDVLERTSGLEVFSLNKGEDKFDVLGSENIMLDVRVTPDVQLRWRETSIEVKRQIDQEGYPLLVDVSTDWYGEFHPDWLEHHADRLSRRIAAERVLDVDFGLYRVDVSLFSSEDEKREGMSPLRALAPYVPPLF